jgi:heme oxygenase
MTGRTSVRSDTPLGVLDAVRRATAEQHHDLESLALNARLLCDDYRIDEYRGLLQRMYGFYEPLAVSAANAHARSAPMIAECAARLGDDLLDLGAALAPAQRCEQLPSFTTSDRELGCRYVLEGSALGGRVITKHLARIFSGANPPLRFFSGNGDATAVRWKSFCAELDARADNVDDVCAAACAAFDVLANWLAQDGERAAVRTGGASVL